MTHAPNQTHLIQLVSLFVETPRPEVEMCAVGVPPGTELGKTIVDTPAMYRFKIKLIL